MFIELHKTFTEELVFIKVENILYIRDLFYCKNGDFKTVRGAEVCLNGYDFVVDTKGRSHKTRIKFSVIETTEQILNLLSEILK